MPINPQKTVRKLVSMPKEIWMQVKAFRDRHRSKSESKAMLELIKLGLKKRARRKLSGTGRQAG